MPRVENHVQRLNSGDGTPKKSKPKNRKSNETPSGKSMPNTSIRANFVGRDVEVRLRNGKIINGVCADPVFGSVFKLCNAYVSPGAGFENIVFPKNMHYNELELAVEEIVEITAHLGNPKKRFVTDGEYSVNQRTSEENYKLVQWDGGESTETFDNTEGKGGWSVEEMFKKNQSLGVCTTYKDDLTQYTTCEPIGSEEDRARAAKIAREIETNVKSKHLAFLENDDEERDIDKETQLPDGVEPNKTETNEPEADGNPVASESEKKTTFHFNPDAPAFIPKPQTPVHSGPVAVTPVPLQPPPHLPQSTSNNGHQGYIVAPGLGMQQNNGVVTQTFIPQPIPMMQLYNPSMLNGAQQMQTIPSLIQNHPQNVIIRGTNDYQNTYIQTNPGTFQVQQVPMYRLPVQAQQQQQQQVTLYQIQPPQPQQQHHYQPRPNHYSGGGRPRKNNNHGNNNNNNSWQQQSHQLTQSTSGHSQSHHQPRYQQLQQIPQNQLFLPQISQMGPVYVNPNAAVTSSSGNNVIPPNFVPVNMFPQYAQPYQRVDGSNINGMMAIQGQLPQNAVMVGPNMIMQQQPMHHQGGNHIVHSQPQTPAPAVHQGSSPPMHFPPNVNVPPPPIQKKMTPLQTPPQYAMHTPVVISNPSQIRITPLIHPKGPLMGMNNGPPPHRKSGGGRRRD